MADLNAYKRYIDTFSSNYITLARQEYSALQNIAMRKEAVDSRIKYIDRIGKLSMTQRTSVLEDKNFVQTDGDRIGLETFYADLNSIVTDSDIKRAMTDPKSIEVENHAQAYGEYWDDKFIASLTADVKLESGSALTFSADGGLTVPVNASGLTKAKLDLVMQNFLINNVAYRGTELYLLTSGKGLVGLRQDTEIKDKDYITSDNPAMLNGATFYMPEYRMNIIVQDRLPFDSGTNVRDCFVFTNKAMIEGTTQELQTTMSEQVAKKGNPMSIDSQVCFGFVRAQGKHVQKVEILES